MPFRSNKGPWQYSRFSGFARCLKHAFDQMIIRLFRSWAGSSPQEEHNDAGGQSTWTAGQYTAPVQLGRLSEIWFSRYYL